MSSPAARRTRRRPRSAPGRRCSTIEPIPAPRTRPISVERLDGLRRRLRVRESDERCASAAEPELARDPRRPRVPMRASRGARGPRTGAARQARRRRRPCARARPRRRARRGTAARPGSSPPPMPVPSVSMTKSPRPRPAPSATPRRRRRCRRCRRPTGQVRSAPRIRGRSRYRASGTFTEPTTRARALVDPRRDAERRPPRRRVEQLLDRVLERVQQLVLRPRGRRPLVACGSDPPSRSTMPARIFVPPTSTPITGLGLQGRRLP